MNYWTKGKILRTIKEAESFDDLKWAMEQMLDEIDKLGEERNA